MNSVIVARTLTMPSVSRPPTKNPNPGVVGANIKRLRKGRGWSQEALARRAGISRSTVATAELGRYKSVDFPTVEAVARAFEVTLLELTEPQPSTAPMPPIVAEFLKSSVAKGLNLSDDDIGWLKALPEATWTGGMPDNDDIAELMLWRKRFSKRKGLSE
jgi:transcriptional regulator with XRE-family HTH domain